MSRPSPHQSEPHGPRSPDRDPCAPSPLPPHTLVIGYGNDLRGDDAIGPRIAEEVATWGIPGVQAIAVHQLLPELAEILALVDTAIFVDACALAPECQASPHQHAPESTITIQPLHPSTRTSTLGHIADPTTLLALAATLYARCPTAWVIGIPAQHFTFGAALSPLATQGIAAALQHIRSMIESKTKKK